MKSDMSRRYHTRVVTNILYSAVISCLVEIFLVTNVSMIARYMEESGRMNRLLQAVLDYHVAVVLVYVVSGLVLFAVMFMILQEPYIRYISNISDAVQSISEGNLNTTIDVIGDDEFSSMAANLNKMVEDIRELIRRAVYDRDRGMGTYDAVIEDDAAEFLADTANGDARAALNAVELGILTTERGPDGKIHIDLAVAQECIQKRVVRYDKNGDNHYDTVSAFIKSMRGSDPDAAVYYLARMLYAGEDIKFIARRIMICASEDVGNADPQALTVAVSAAQAVERIGMPEAQIILSQAVTYVATAPKSNAACMAVGAAAEAVASSRTMPVPVHLQDKHYKGAQKLGHGLGYKYAHDYPKHYVKQQYLPDGMEGSVFYEPSDNGYEREIRRHMAWLKEEDT